ncbi:MAG: acyl carrier protein [Bacteroidaceae bacterium]|jgi:acyl carrier protein|nr:acyl carrier protein [Bacteroidaceae bacterium]
MERKEIFSKLNEIFIDVLDLDECNLTDETNANDIEEWDSLSHIQLIVAIEKRFGIKFTSLEIMKWRNVGELVDSILSKK